ncbi:MAG: CoA-binding protein [bacterium]
MTIPEILKEFRTIAVVGLSTNPGRPSYRVSRYMQDQGYRIVPVRPGADEILGEKVYPTLKDIPFPVQIIDVFRRSETVLPIAEEAVAIGAKVLWLQEKIINHDAQRICKDAGMEVIMDRCILQEHRKAGLAG